MKTYNNALSANQPALDKATVHLKAVNKWLKHHPHIGVMNGGKYYKIINGETVNVPEFGQ